MHNLIPRPTRTAKCPQRVVGTVSLFAILSASAVACSLVVQGASTPQCRVDSDCAGRQPHVTGASCVSGVCQVSTSSIASTDGGKDGAGAADASAPNNWDCLSKPAYPPFSKLSYSIIVHLRDGLSSTSNGSLDPYGGIPIVGATIQVCGTLDTNCSVPHTPPVTTDSRGVAVVDFPANTSNYLNINAPNYVRFLSYPAMRLLPQLETVPAEMSMVKRSDLPALVGLAQVTPDPNLGQIFFGVVYCDANPQLTPGGVSMALDKTDPSTALFYMNGNLPSLTATKTDPNSGGGFFNVPPGGRTVSASLQATGQRIGARTILIVPDAITQVVLDANDE